MDWTTIITTGAFLLGGGFILRFIVWLPLKSALKRQEEARAGRAEIEMSSLTNEEYVRLIKQLRDEKADLLLRFAEYDKKFERQERINSELMAQLGLKNKELMAMDDRVTKYTRAIRAQMLCEIKADDCPILMKIKDLNK